MAEMFATAAAILIPLYVNISLFHQLFVPTLPLGLGQ